MLLMHFSCLHARAVESHCQDVRYAYYTWAPQMDFYFKIKLVTLAPDGNQNHSPNGIRGKYRMK